MGDTPQQVEIDDDEDKCRNMKISFPKGIEPEVLHTGRRVQLLTT
jgi:hypothetical protein